MQRAFFLDSNLRFVLDVSVRRRRSGGEDAEKGADDVDVAVAVSRGASAAGGGRRAHGVESHRSIRL